MSHSSYIAWHVRPFRQMSAAMLHDAYALRQEVFILKQKCLYPDIDADDIRAIHVLGYQHYQDADVSGHALAAYLRIIPPVGGYAPDNPYKIGRVVVAPELQGQRLGDKAMQIGMDYLFNECGQEVVIRLSAQTGLVNKLYSRCGFHAISAPYVADDGIEHVDMQYTPGNRPKHWQPLIGLSSSGPAGTA